MALMEWWRKAVTGIRAEQRANASTELPESCLCPALLPLTSDGRSLISREPHARSPSREGGALTWFPENSRCVPEQRVTEKFWDDGSENVFDTLLEERTLVKIDLNDHHARCAVHSGAKRSAGLQA